jgi:hypothetical protein
VIDGWFYALEQDVLADESVDASNAEELLARTNALMEAGWPPSTSGTGLLGGAAHLPAGRGRRRHACWPMA